MATATLEAEGSTGAARPARRARALVVEAVAFKLPESAERYIEQGMQRLRERQAAREEKARAALLRRRNGPGDRRGYLIRYRETKAAFKAFAAQYFGVAVDSIADDSKLADFARTPHDLICLSFEVEGRWGFRFPDEEKGSRKTPKANTMRRVADYVKYITRYADEGKAVKKAK